MIDQYTYVIVALLPLSALMLVFQTNPYHALVIRAILGAVAALVYAVLGAADVALTEALVGTMLAITLYVIAVRSSLVMRLGIVTADKDSTNSLLHDRYLQELITSLRKVIKKYHLRLELVEYPDLKTLKQGLKNKEVHAVCSKQEPLANSETKNNTAINIKQIYNTEIRIHRLFEIIENELNFPETALTYITIPNVEEKH